MKTLIVSEWLLFSANSAILSAISWREHVNCLWDDDEIRFEIVQRAELDFDSASSLKQQSAGRHSAAHTDTLFWFRANPSLHFLLNAMCLPKKQLEPTIYHTRGDHAKQYAIDAVK